MQLAGGPKYLPETLEICSWTYGRMPCGHRAPVACAQGLTSLPPVSSISHQGRRNAFRHIDRHSAYAPPGLWSQGQSGSSL